jgi:hypothetical protein
MNIKHLCILCVILIGACFFAATQCSAAAPELTSEWTQLLRGDTFDGWYVVTAGQEKPGDPNHIFTVKDGVVHAYADATAGEKAAFAGLFTEKEYSRYHLQLEFKWGTKKFVPRMDAPRDAGILFHITQPYRVWPQSVECQIQEGDVGDIFAVYCAVATTIDPKTKDAIDPVSKLNSPVFMEAKAGGVSITQSAEGSQWGVGRVRRSQDCEREGWNTVDVIVDGDHAAYLVNGKLNNRCCKMLYPDPKDSKRMIPLTQGRILLQAEWAEIFYRNIQIKDLSEAEKSILQPQP